MSKKNLRRISVLVTAQTAANLERLTRMDGQASMGRTVDKLVRDRMIALRKPELWRAHYLSRFGRCPDAADEAADEVGVSYNNAAGKVRSIRLHTGVDVLTLHGLGQLYDAAKALVEYWEG